MKKDYVYYSNVNNYESIFNSRKEIFNKAFSTYSDDITNITDYKILPSLWRSFFTFFTFMCVFMG